LCCAVPCSVWCTRPGRLWLSRQLAYTCLNICKLADPPLCLPAVLTAITSIVCALFCTEAVCQCARGGVLCSRGGGRVQGSMGEHVQWETCSTGIEQLPGAFNGHVYASHGPGQPGVSVCRRNPPRARVPKPWTTSWWSSVQGAEPRMLVLRWGVCGQ
jgi:hypothetical protein